MIEFIDLGRTAYDKCLSIQKEVLKERIDGSRGDTVIFTEHDTVVTLGRTSGKDSILDPAWFSDLNIDILRTGRGGDITCHMPGQLMVYPMIDLRHYGRDIRKYIDLLEEVVTLSLRSIGVEAERLPGKRGVWSRGKKIAFSGVAVKKWITWHGIAVNVNNDIEPFSRINPCGRSDITVTTASSVLGSDIEMGKVKNMFMRHLTGMFDHENTA